MNMSFSSFSNLLNDDKKDLSSVDKYNNLNKNKMNPKYNKSGTYDIINTSKVSNDFKFNIMHDNKNLASHK